MFVEDGLAEAARARVNEEEELLRVEPERCKSLGILNFFNLSEKDEL